MSDETPFKNHANAGPPPGNVINDLMKNVSLPVYTYQVESEDTDTEYLPMVINGQVIDINMYNQLWKQALAKGYPNPSAAIEAAPEGKFPSLKFIDSKSVKG